MEIARCPDCKKPLTYTGESYGSMGKGKRAKEFSDTIIWDCEPCVKHWEMDIYTKHLSGRKGGISKEDEIKLKKFREVNKQFSKFGEGLKGREKELYYLGIQIGIGFLWTDVVRDLLSGNRAIYTQAKIIVSYGLPDDILKDFKRLKKQEG